MITANKRNEMQLSIRQICEHNMLVQRKKVSDKTTNSYHRFYKHNNLIKKMEINAPNQVWVSDITYTRTIKGFCYLALITDLYSKKIVIRENPNI
jgi:transposase InsO family protein